ncbi:hypothetical protein, partial [Amaricoccus sp. W119]|uniref:hypothetical protein n=1 Tax=Amaricoccus sp. W119 TaxID=3391833 RepID=UPI0039A6C514
MPRAERRPLASTWAWMATPQALYLYKFRLDLTSGVRMSVMFRLSASDRAAIIFSLAIGAAS